MTLDNLKRFDKHVKAFETIQRLIAAPHTTLTSHDRHRAMALVLYMRLADLPLQQYVTEIMTESSVEDEKALTKIADCVWP